LSSVVWLLLSTCSEGQRAFLEEGWGNDFDFSSSSMGPRPQNYTTVRSTYRRFLHDREDRWPLGRTTGLDRISKGNTCTGDSCVSLCIASQVQVQSSEFTPLLDPSRASDTAELLTVQTRSFHSGQNACRLDLLSLRNGLTSAAE
jgi:hypothetical protein